jgi:hypothetical protein
MTDESELNAGNQITPEQQDAAMAAGFGAERGTMVPPEVTELNTEVAELPEDESALQAAPGPSDVDRLRAEMASMGESIKKSFEQVHGKFGEHNRLIQEVVKGKTAAAGAAGAPARKVGADAFRKLALAYPDIAAQMTEGLENVLAAQSATGLDATALDARVNAKVAELIRPAVEAVQTASDQKIAKVELSVMHPDWQKVTSTRDFSNWFKAKPATEQHRLFYSWDAPSVATMLSEYKTAAKRTVAASSDRQRRLAAAVAPAGRGSGASTGISDDDALVLGFKAARSAG